MHSSLQPWIFFFTMPSGKACIFGILGRSIALALIKSGIKKKGTKLIVPTINKSVEVEVTNPVFIDPKNERLLA